MNGRNIRFRVQSANSEAEDGMTMRLQTGEAGWESSRSCAYPQQLTLQLLLPILTKSITLVFHQYKIPSQIELFIKAVRNEKWRKLGFIRPSDNSQSGYEEKEQRTVFLEFPCSFVRLVMHQPYENDYNLFQQVALEKVQITGDILPPRALAQYNVEQLQSEEEESDEEQVPPETQRSEIEEEECRTDRNMDKKYSNQTKAIIRQEFQEVFKELEARKIQAVQREEYEQAASLKQRLKVFKDLEQRLSELEAAKRIATQNEDYEKCAQLKTQIVLLRQTIELEVNNFFSGRQSGPHSSSMLSQYESTPQQQINLTQLTAIPVRYTDYKSNVNNSTIEKPAQKVPHDDQVLPALIHKAMNDNRQRLDLEPVPEPKQEKPSTEQQQQPQLSKRLSVDEKSLKRLEVHYSSISQKTWQDICTKDWKTREKAFKELETLEIRTKEVMLAAYELCSITITDKHPNVIIHTLLLLTRVIHSEANVNLRSPPPVPQFLNDQLLQAVVALLGDSNQKIRQLSLSTLLEMPELAIVPTGQVLHHLIRSTKTTNKQSPKLMQSKLHLARKIVERYTLTNSELEGLLNWAVECLEDSYQEVRASATELIVSGLMPRLGEGLVRKKVQHIRSNILESFLMTLNNSLQFDHQQHSQFNHVHRVGRDNTLVEYDEYYAGRKDEVHEIPLQSGKKQPRQLIEPPLSSKDKKQTRVLELTHQEINQLEQEQTPDLSKCDYCRAPLQIVGTVENAFLEHITTCCRAVVTCEKCAGWVYIRDLQTHLVKECEADNGELYKQCRKCRLAFPSRDMYAHEAQNSCKALPYDMERCQLCATNIPPNDDAWLKHCYVCPNNQSRPPK